MRSSSTVKRLALATTVTGALLGAAPALANAASTCSFTPDPLRPRVDVFDGSGTAPLVVKRASQFIAIQDGASPAKLCPGATVTNTDQINVHGSPAASLNGHDDFIVDQGLGKLAPGAALESDGTSEIETVIDTGGVAFALDVFGTALPDTMRVSAGGGVMLGSDSDVDIRARSAAHVVLVGSGASDFLSGRGGAPASSPAPSTTTVTLAGGQGSDTLVDGPLSGDQLQGEDDNDTLFSHDFNGFDHNFGQEGFDQATIDANDFHALNDIEKITVASVGRLRLARPVITADAGKPTRVTLAWEHPKAWRQLRALKLRASEAGDAVATVTIDPARGRISDRGAISATRGSAVTHRGKTVTAHLRLRPSKQLAGRTLHLAVQATDAHGHTQTEPLAGRLIVAG